MCRSAGTSVCGGKDLLTAACRPAVELARLFAFGSIDAVETYPLAVNFDGVTVDDRGLTDDGLGGREIKSKCCTDLFVELIPDKCTDCGISHDRKKENLRVRKKGFKHD